MNSTRIPTTAMKRPGTDADAWETKGEGAAGHRRHRWQRADRGASRGIPWTIITFLSAGYLPQGSPDFGRIIHSRSTRTRIHTRREDGRKPQISVELLARRRQVCSVTTRCIEVCIETGTGCDVPMSTAYGALRRRRDAASCLQEVSPVHLAR